MKRLRILNLLLLSAMIGLSVACNPDSNSSNAGQHPDSLAAAAKDTLSPFKAPSKERIKETTGGENKYIKGQFNIPKAMAVVYGLYDEKLECSKWICAAEDRPGFKEIIGNDGHVYTRAKQVLDFETGGFKHKFLVTESPRMDDGGWQTCHACDVVLGLAMFTEIDGDWFIQAFRRDLGRFGSYGELPKPELIQFGADNYGIKLVESTANQGETEDFTVLIGLSKDLFEVLFNEKSAYSNEGMFFPGFHGEKAYAWSSTIGFKKGKHSDFDDLVFTIKGKQPLDESDEKSKIVPINESLIYHYNGKAYEPEDVPAQ